MTRLWHDVIWFSRWSCNEIVITRDCYATAIWRKAGSLRFKPSCMRCMHAADKQMMPQTICNVCLGHLSHMEILEDLGGGWEGGYILCRCIWAPAWSTRALPLKPSAGRWRFWPEASWPRSPHITSALPPEEGAVDILKYPRLIHMSHLSHILHPHWLAHRWKSKNKIKFQVGVND